MKMPHILSQQVVGDTANFVLKTDTKLLYYHGHFTDNPILPGVVQVGWAVHIATSLFNISATVSGLKKIKFNRIIQPGGVLHLYLEINRERHRLKYRYTDGVANYSSGEVVLGGK